MAGVASFEVDHTKLKPGLYVSRVDRFNTRANDFVRGCPSCRGCTDSLPVTTFDLRIVPPNSELRRPLEPASIHTIEHLGAIFFRNEQNWKDRVVYFGPMGCRTGFYLILAGDLSPNKVIDPKFRFQTVRELVIGMCWYIMSFTADKTVPGATPEECGNYLDHNILSARLVANDYYAILSQSSDDLGYD